MAFTNESKNTTTLTNESKNTTTWGLGGDALLQENNDFLLTEDGFKILLEEGNTGIAAKNVTTYTNETKNES